MKIAWWSAGITSAVAVKMALEMYNDVQIYYTETGSAHEDNDRFKRDCERWYSQEIITVRNRAGYKDHLDVIDKTGCVNGAGGARCTLELKKQVRFDLETLLAPSLFNDTFLTGQVFGYEFEKDQINRAIRFLEQYPDAKPLFPLIEKGLNKDRCAGIIMNAGIDLPAMYLLGYSNNNCIGCVKGGKGYWNKIRIDFPNTFKAMSLLERKKGHSCIKDCFLDELDPNAGMDTKIVTPSCDHFCDVEFVDMPSLDLELILSGTKNIKELYPTYFKPC